jgi:hypothetical protein
MNLHETARFQALSRMVGATARDLDLLGKIEKTISALNQIKEQMTYHTATVCSEIERVKTDPNVIDEDGSIIESLEETRDLLGTVHAQFVKKCEAAKKASELREEDGVVEAYYDMLNATADLHNAINTLCWTIGEHDVDLEDKTPHGPFSSADELFAALGH